MGLKSEIRVRKITHRMAKDIIIKNHYSHRMPISTILNLGIFYQGRLVGCIIYNQGNSTAYHNLIRMATKNKNLELIRLWTEDNLPKGLLSRAIAVSISLIKKHNPLLEFIVSFADEAYAGHMGTIYQASNFIYVGSHKGIEKDIYINGKKYHTRGIGATFGTSKIDELKKRFKVRIVERKNLKHKYIYPLKKEIREEVNKLSKEYPINATVV